MALASAPLPYTASPYRLAIADLILFARITFVWPPSKGVLSTILPLLPFRSGALDELYPTLPNLVSFIFQLIFSVTQLAFIISVPISAIFGIGFPVPPLLGAYVPVWLLWVIVFIFLNRLASIIFLDSTKLEFQSQVALSEADLKAHADEKWIFVNGVATGSHWMQSNLDRLSLGFRREIYGIHNQTRGLLFDLFEVIIERVLSYSTISTRMVYSRLLDVISNDKYTRIVLILHSQGAIEGGLALDWLFATVPNRQLSRVEVYTFGNAANHWNDPTASTLTSLGKRMDIIPDPNNPSSESTRVVKHIEHYANSGDYVSKFGILHYRPLPPSMTQFMDTSGMYMKDSLTEQAVENRYVGRLFIRQSSGHLLNNNYLDNFFQMNEALTETLDYNDIMDTIIDPDLLSGYDIVAAPQLVGSAVDTEQKKSKARNLQTASGISTAGTVRFKDVSRLWQYRNGMTPSA